MTDVHVCTTCRPAGADRNLPAAGLLLLEAVQRAALPHGPAVRVHGTACMSGCSRACTVALMAPGKTTYFFGDLPADDRAAEEVLACARLHAASADGLMARNDRPPLLRNGILARLPAAPVLASAAGQLPETA
ncbi:DUF1636 domain-containing protein [Aquincola sp. MAHUQ-54]|uniref:DUF1636 domain-containing protein n=1 Tax=Aquincola agrisoli TaxID=3119538 RepID=A0AAW9Q7R7_9BURK